MLVNGVDVIIRCIVVPLLSSELHYSPQSFDFFPGRLLVLDAGDLGRRSTLLSVNSTSRARGNDIQLEVG